MSQPNIAGTAVSGLKIMEGKQGLTELPSDGLGLDLESNRGYNHPVDLKQEALTTLSLSAGIPLDRLRFIRNASKSGWKAWELPAGEKPLDME